MAVRFSNDKTAGFFVASGALAFDGRGWPWEKPMRHFGLIDTSLFAVVGKSVTLEPRRGNLRWWKPWTCVRRIPDGVVNKVGLTNPGFDAWFKKDVPRILRKDRFVASLFGTESELLQMIGKLNYVSLFAVEINVSCPNTGHDLGEDESTIRTLNVVASRSNHPVIAKLSVTQDYVKIAKGIYGMAEAITFNSVPWEKVFPNKPSPLSALQEKVGGGGGGVSGKAAQPFNWEAVEEVKSVIPKMQVIAPSVWDYEDIRTLFNTYGADAVSFGAIHLKHLFGAALPTLYANRYLREMDAEEGRRHGNIHHANAR